MFCYRCHRRLGPIEPVYRYRGRTQDPLESEYDRRLTMCAECFKKTWYSKSPEYVSEPRPCIGCGRIVIDCGSYWEPTHCNDWYRLDYYRTEAKKERALARGKRACAPAASLSRRSGPIASIVQPHVNRKPTGNGTLTEAETFSDSGQRTPHQNPSCLFLHSQGGTGFQTHPLITSPIPSGRITSLHLRRRLDQMAIKGQAGPAVSSSKPAWVPST